MFFHVICERLLKAFIIFIVIFFFTSTDMVEIQGNPPAQPVSGSVPTCPHCHGLTNWILNVSFCTIGSPESITRTKPAYCFMTVLCWPPSVCTTALYHNPPVCRSRLISRSRAARQRQKSPRGAEETEHDNRKKSDNNRLHHIRQLL